MTSVTIANRPGQDVARTNAGRGMSAWPVDGRSFAIVMLLNLILFTFFTNAATEAGVV